MNVDLKILKKYNIKAKKSLGQNFLVNNEVTRDIASIINIKGKNIIEIGPGYGALTEELLKYKPKSLSLVELDNNMINILNLRLKSGEFDISGIDFKIENIDILEYNNSGNLKSLSQFSPQTSPNPLLIGEARTKEATESGKEEEYFVIANIPYYITSPILRHFLYDIENKPEKMLILMQKDVGDRITQTPSNSPLSRGRTKTFSLLDEGKLRDGDWFISPLDKGGLRGVGKSSVLSLLVQKKCFVEEVLFVGKENFAPQPKVESSVLLFELHDLYKDIPDKLFLEFIKKGFREPRKKLLKNLINAGYEKESVLKIFGDLGIDENVRGEDLDVKRWCELSVKVSG